MFPSRSNLPYTNETNHILRRRLFKKGRESLTSLIGTLVGGAKKKTKARGVSQPRA
jgi:hypothetical protein